MLLSNDHFDHQGQSHNGEEEVETQFGLLKAMYQQHKPDKPG